jgi:hypothetical protein
LAAAILKALKKRNRNVKGLVFSQNFEIGTPARNLKASDLLTLINQHNE